MNISSLPLALACLLLSASAQAASPAPSQSGAAWPERTAARVTQPEHYARRCQSHPADRQIPPPGALLWGTKRTWGDSQQSTDERRSVLVSVDGNNAYDWEDMCCIPSYNAARQPTSNPPQ